MTNAELIKALRYCGQEQDVIDCADCERRVIENGVDVDCEGRLLRDAADALEAAEKRIAEQQKQIAQLYVLLNNRINEIAELERQHGEQLTRNVMLVAQLPKEGEWIGIEYDGYADGCPVYDVWECSECGEEHNGEEDTLPNYCPNCGARMKGEQE